MAIFNAVEIAMASFGQKHGLEIIIDPEASTAATNGKRVVLPVVSKENESAMWGFIHHEAAHVRLTDFSAGLAQSGAIFSILNCVEDVWIEFQTIVGGYAGAKKRFNDLNSMLIEKGDWSPITKNMQPLSAVCMYVCFYGAYKITGYQSCEEAFNDSHPVMLALIGKDKLNKLERLIDEVRKNKSTLDNIETAKAIYALFQEKKPDQNQNQDQGGSQGQDQGDDQGGSQGDDQGQDQGGSQGKSGSQGDDFDLDTGEARSFDKGEAAAKLLDGGEVKGHHYQLQYANRPAKKLDSDSLSWKRDLFRDAMVENAGLVSLLGSLFEAKNRTQRDHQRKGRRLSVRRYAEMASTGNERIFANKTETAAPNTAVSLLVDRSGSMKSRVENKKTAHSSIATATQSRMEIANKAALTMVKSLEAIKGIKSEVHYFDNACYLAKSYDENCSDFVDRLCSYYGGTAMGTGLYNAGLSLLQRSEPKKVMMIICDGDIGDSICAERFAHELADNGVEVYFIAIDDPDGFEACKSIAPDKKKVQFLSSNKLVDVLMALAKDIAI